MRKQKLRITFLLAGVLVLVPAVKVDASSLSTTLRITHPITGHAVGINSSKPVGRTMSRDGRITVFESTSGQLTADDRNASADIFAYDRITNKLELISRTPSGGPADGRSELPSVSADGRYVAFASYAQNLLPSGAATCLCRNLFVADRQTKQITWVNRNTLGLRIDAEPTLPWINRPIISGDGRTVAFVTRNPVNPDDTQSDPDVVVRDIMSNVTRPVSLDTQGNLAPDGAHDPSLSYDGRYVVFTTFSSLVPNDDNNTSDVYIRDMQLARTTLISWSKHHFSPNRASFEPLISTNGRYVVYVSRATNIVDDDTNEANDIFLYSLETGQTKRVNVSNRGQQANGESFQADISSDGRYVTYLSAASNLVLGDTAATYDIFLFYRDYGVTRRVNRASHDGAIADGASFTPSISADGKAITFKSTATNLTPLGTATRDQLYLTYNPVVDIPYYDSYDRFEIY